MTPVLEILSPGLSASLQDEGRAGWKRFGIPQSGAMDIYSARWANTLLENPPGAPVLELLMGGARLRALKRTWISFTGAHALGDLAPWKAAPVEPGKIIDIGHVESGLWSYIGIEGGFHAARFLGSASVYPRGKLGRTLQAGDILYENPVIHEPVQSVASRLVHWADQRDFSSMPAIGVWPGPQWDMFSKEAKDLFFDSDWEMTSQSDRVGYRLHGPPLPLPKAEILSEPVRCGSIQVPPNGQPIVTMRDGPTIGGYPKIGLVGRDAFYWLAQAAPGTTVGFKLLATSSDAAR